MLVRTDRTWRGDFTGARREPHLCRVVRPRPHDDVIAPEIASLLARSIRALVVRVRAQNTTATAVAEFLAEHPCVTKVHHPSLATGDQATIIKTQMRGPGGMLSFLVDGDATTAAAVVDRLRVFSIAPSLGGAESLVTQPITTTHHGLDPAERTRRGIADSMIRLSVGLEDAEDLIADLAHALDGTAMPGAT